MSSWEGAVSSTLLVAAAVLVAALGFLLILRGSRMPGVEKGMRNDMKNKSGELNGFLDRGS